MDPINDGLSAVGSFNKFIETLALPVTRSEILNEFLIGQEKKCKWQTKPKSCRNRIEWN